MAIARTMKGPQREGTSRGAGRLVPGVTVVLSALILGGMLGLLGQTATAVVLIGVAAVVLALISPYWALVIAVVQWAFIPSEGTFLWMEKTPNQLQYIAPVLVIAALLSALKDRASDRLSPQVSDLTVGGLGLWGLIGLVVRGYAPLYKWYTNRMILPMAFYYAVRLIKLTRERVIALIGIASAAVGLQSLLMIRQSIAGSSPLYGDYRRFVQGVKPAIGPFIYHWNAGTFLAQWPPLAVYMIARSTTAKAKAMWMAILIVLLIANVRTMQRASIVASLIAIGICLLAPKLKRTTVAVIATIALAYIPWSGTTSGGALMDRFDLTDESRYARRTVAIDLLKSSRWDPIFGVGWTRGHDYTAGLGTGEEIMVWGVRRTTIEDFAGTKLHNVWLQVLVEMGTVGALLALAVILSAVTSSVKIIRRSRDRPVDIALLVAIWASLVAIGSIGYYQHIWHMPASMSVMWLLYGIIVRTPQVFDIVSEPGGAQDDNGIGGRQYRFRERRSGRSANHRLEIVGEDDHEID